MSGLPKSFDDDMTREIELVNTNDGVVKRVQWEHDCYERASQRALRQYQQLIDMYSRMFGQRVGQILRDPEVKLPPLTPEFLEIGDQPR